MLTRIYSQGLS